MPDMTLSESTNTSGAIPDLSGHTPGAPDPEGTGTGHTSSAQKLFKRLGWVGLGLGCLVFFTILKLPEDRIRGFVQGTIASQLGAQGISLTAGKSSLSIGLGISYTMKDVTLNFPAPQDPVKIDYISVSPAVIPLLSGKIGASITLENKGGSLKGTFTQPLKGPSGPISFSYTAKNLNIGSLGLLPATLGIRGSAILDGEGEVSGDTSLPSTLNGTLRLDLAKLTIDAQSVMGFTIPQLTISQGKLDVSIEKGKALIKTLSLGRTGSTTDDLHGTVTGDITLGKNLAYSTLNLKAEFGLSQSVLKAFVLLDAILGVGKQADGSYAYSITGPLNSPTPIPGKH